MDWREKLRKRIEQLGLKRAEIARMAKVGPTAVRDMLDRGHAPSVDQLAKIANVLGYTLPQLLEGTDHVQLLLRVHGISGGGGMWAEVPKAHNRVLPIDFFNEDHVVIEVSGNDLLPSYRAGDVISGPKTTASGLHNLIGSDVIVELEDGRRLVGILMRGNNSGLYNLRPFDAYGEERRDVAIAWAAPIRMILRGHS